MKHAGAQTLSLLEPLIAQLRKHSVLREKTPGCFYLKSRGFLHFHEDPAGLFADVRLGGDDFTRLEVTSKTQQRALLARVDAHLARAAQSSRS